MKIDHKSKRSTMLTVYDNLRPEQEKYYANSFGNKGSEQEKYYVNSTGQFRTRAREVLC